MTGTVTTEELVRLRARYQSLDLPDQLESENQAVQDVLRLLDHIAELGAENATLLEYKYEVLGWGRALSEGWPDRR